MAVGPIFHEAPLAIYSWTAQALSRSDDRSAVAAAAYRAGIYLRDDRTGLAHDFTKRRGLRAEIILPSGIALPAPTAPGWLEEIRSRLWNAAEAAERRINSVVAREIVIALPCELDEVDRVALGQGYGRWLADRYRVAVDVAWHPPSSSGDDRNHHLHVQFTTREVDNGFAFGRKTRILDHAATGGPEFAIMRKEWAAQANAALEAAGFDVRIDHRSLVDRGIDREPDQHLGPARTNMIRAEEKALAALDIEIAAREARIRDLLAEEAAEIAAEEARRRPPSVVIKGHQTGPVGPYMAPAPVPFGAWMKEATASEVTPPAPAPINEKPASPAAEPLAEPSSSEPTEPSPTAAVKQPKSLAAGDLEAAVNDAVQAELDRQRQIHAAAAEKAKADAEEEEATAAAKKRARAGRAKTPIVMPGPAKRPYLHDEPPPRYKQKNLKPLVVDQREPEEEDGKPKRAGLKKPMLPQGPKMPALARSKSQVRSRSNIKGKGRGGPER